MDTMTKRARKALICWLFLFFLGIGSVVILYAQGWRIHGKTLLPVKIGALYVRPLPSSAMVAIDEKEITDKTSLFSNGFFENNIIPDIYTVSVRAEGYETWQKRIRILPSLITQFKYVVLIPIKEEKVFEKEIDEFRIARNTLITKDGNGNLFANGILLSGNEIIATSEQEPYLVSYRRAREQFALERYDAKETVFFKSSSSQMTIVPEQSQPTIIAQSKYALRIIEIKNSPETRAILRVEKTLLAITASQRWVAWAEKDSEKNSRVYLYNILTRATSSEPHLFPGIITKLSFSPQGILGVLQDRGDAYTLDPSSGVQRILANDVRDFVFEKEGLSIAALERTGIEIVPLTSSEKYRRFSIQDASLIASIEWYRDGQHLFLHYPDTVKFLDFEDNEATALVTVAETPNAEYNPVANELYYLKNRILMKKVFPR